MYMHSVDNLKPPLFYGNFQEETKVYYLLPSKEIQYIFFI